jgi:hypothetical protein
VRSALYLLDFRRSTERRSTDFRLLARLIVRLLSVFALPSAAGALESTWAEEAGAVKRLPMKAESLLLQQRAGEWRAVLKETLHRLPLPRDDRRPAPARASAVKASGSRQHHLQDAERDGRRQNQGRPRAVVVLNQAFRHGANHTHKPRAEPR